MQAGILTFDELWRLTDGVAIGDHADVACPLCSKLKSKHGARRQVLRVWCKDEGMLTYTCARCTASGWVKRDGEGDGTVPVQREHKPPSDRRLQARELWDKGIAINGTLAMLYLKCRKCLFESESIQYLPPTEKFYPSMLARFSSKNGLTNGIHMTRLNREGTGKAAIPLPKIMLGPSMGYPIIITKGRGPQGLIIAEGIEDALSYALATDYTVWAAGAAGRIPPLLTRSRLFSKVFVAVDDDEAGLTALRKAQRSCPRLIPINLTRLMNAKYNVDANKVILNQGAVALGEYVKIAEMKAMAVKMSNQINSYGEKDDGLHETPEANRNSP